MKKTLAALSILTFAAACDVAPGLVQTAVAPSATDIVASQIEGTVVNGITINGPIAQLLAGCVVENASPEELAVILGADEGTRNATISSVLVRPATTTCATTRLTA